MYTHYRTGQEIIPSYHVQLASGLYPFFGVQSRSAVAFAIAITKLQLCIEL